MQNNETVLIGTIKWLKSGRWPDGTYWARFYLVTGRSPLNGQERKPINIRCKVVGSNAQIIDEYCTDGTEIRFSGHLAPDKKPRQPDQTKDDWEMIPEVNDEDGSIMMVQQEQSRAKAPVVQAPQRRSKYDSQQMRAATPQETEEYYAEQGAEISADDLPF